MTSQAHQHLPTKVGANIRSAREAAGLTQRQLSIKLDVDTLAVSRWENGRVLPSTRNLVALSQVFECEPGWFYAEPKAAA